MLVCLEYSEDLFSICYTPEDNNSPIINFGSKLQISLHFFLHNYSTTYTDFLKHSDYPDRINIPK